MSQDYRIPIYEYSKNQRWACPECYLPVPAPRGHKDGRCHKCRAILRQLQPQIPISYDEYIYANTNTNS